LPFPGEQRLAEPRLVLGDDGVGGVENMAGRAEILFKAVLMAQINARTRERRTA
jgi:hypothetical protein